MSKIKDETGNQYGLLKVIEKAPSKNGKSYWKCECKCGNIHIVSGTNLRTGQVKSCGKCVYNNKKQNLTGQQFGVLRVIKEIPNRNKITWQCQCIYCGKISEVTGTNLKTGHTKSCSCVQGSTGEKIISEILKHYNIHFVQQFTFPDFKLSTGGIPKFDFAIFNKKSELICLLEFDGEQHFIVTGGWNNQQNHNIIVQRDLEKTQYCQQQNIPLIRIPYYDLNKLNIKYILTKIINKIEGEVNEE